MALALLRINAAACDVAQAIHSAAVSCYGGPAWRDLPADRKQQAVEEAALLIASKRQKVPAKVLEIRR